MKSPKFDTLFTQSLVADSVIENYIRSVPNAHFSFVTPKKVTAPKLLHIATETADILGLDSAFLASETFKNIFSGNEIGTNSKPYAMNYAGHQFGQWAGQLGDGRAINLGEINGWAVQLKGAGPTPYSRRGDGFAVLRSSIREHLCSEAMYHLGVPTTRSLALLETGEQVVRDVLHDGNPALEKGAIVCRVAPSFIRFGNFELFSAQNDLENLKKLTDFVISTYFSAITENGKTKYLQFFKHICESTQQLIIEWQRVGFVHGVMNTDNMSIHGITIDYGPYGWLEDYNPDWTPNTTDHQHKRYRFGNQGDIALWNLYQLANALYPLIEDAAALETILHNFATSYSLAYTKMMCQKLGLAEILENDEELVNQLTSNLALQETDMTIFFRLLNTIRQEETAEEAYDKITPSFYSVEQTAENTLKKWHTWFVNYLNRLLINKVTDTHRKKAMDRVNPKYVLRNYMAQLAIEEAEKGNLALLNELHALLKKPYDEQPEYEKWFIKRPDWARTKIGCSMLSCSS